MERKGGDVHAYCITKYVASAERANYSVGVQFSLIRLDQSHLCIYLNQKNDHWLTQKFFQLENLYKNGIHNY